MTNCGIIGGKMGIRELALLCELLSRFYATCDSLGQGLVESVFWAVWEKGRNKACALEFYRAVRDAADRLVE